MKPTWEFTGKTVDAATEIALKALSANIEDVNVKVISAGKSGIFGMGAEEALIEVSFASSKIAQNALKHGPAPTNQPYVKEEDAEGAPAPRPQQSKRSRARGYLVTVPKDEHDTEAEQAFAGHLNKILSYMGVVTDAYLLDDLQDGLAVFELEGEDSGLLIGAAGDTLESLQHLLAMMVRSELNRPTNLLLDVDGYRKKRHGKLEQLARTAVDSVRSTGKPYAMVPMNPESRRQIHLFVATHEDVKSISEGIGRNRYVVVHPSGSGKEEPADVEAA